MVARLLAKQEASVQVGYFALRRLQSMYEFSQSLEVYLRKYLTCEDSLPFRQGEVLLENVARELKVEPLALRFVQLLIKFEVLQGQVAAIEYEQDRLADNVSESHRNSQYYD